ncbi:RNA polymerase sigma factor [Actinoallomurus iriomotensis]|uniref:RNA polymerase subunit sigma-24 n=2 Tax=Actinoallomurus TaxID=667113 RepID=A0A9W6RTY7_9ACTN|nr:sigma-70 family RNA polymerase sigma factor [Actinoallomurus iriomotensis]GLY81524.1 RNA polymerase subunit sigma-24 [Actinoallomurus iriomotensis]
MIEAGDALARLVRAEGTRVLATLVRVTGDIDLAQDAAQDAAVRALETWPRDGVPDNPRAWLLVTAKRRAIDVIRRETRRAGKETEAVMFTEPGHEPAETVDDDLLRLVFTCCHPALSVEAQVALALRTLGGLSTAEVARGLMVSEATMAKRLTRAKQKTLLLLQDARRDARVDDEGRVLLLKDQDRGRWDASAIKEGIELVGRALRRTPDRPDPYVVQAAIAACHALAPTYADTNWDAVLSWYDVLLRVQDGPVVRLNRAAAVAERDGLEAGMALVEAIEGLDAYPWWHATRGELLCRMGRPAAARAAYERALALGMSAPQAEHMRRRITGLS